ncbi:nuclear transport factor 2 family protein [Mucilaginibacter jinjuensis]|uniref:Nuclear transport factor 2 family protein n=1 Tax=Mucilaginibacter jinjuensis TaxID=1176721 RepID=A0ABY7TAP3_9SPHI|nr:nuclear transport factor 2 family protein [Mucilaginibacter jinjuensis]WCT13273.1 nuclear transport factor 2 family protein [Mucilaginibacter jinjuensis]
MIANCKHIIVLFGLIALTTVSQGAKTGQEITGSNTPTQEVEKRKGIAVQYFRSIDKGAVDSTFFNQFTDDVDFYFPKFGNVKGKSGISKFFRDVGSSMRSIHHDIQNFKVIGEDNYVVVEGQESGVMKDGVVWPDNKVSHGRFCCVFEFRGDLISRFYIYVDPDFTSSDQVRIDRFKQKAEQ